MKPNKGLALKELGRLLLAVVSPVVELAIIAIVVLVPAVVSFLSYGAMQRGWWTLLMLALSILCVTLGYLSLRWVRANGVEWTPRDIDECR